MLAEHIPQPISFFVVYSLEGFYEEWQQRGKPFIIFQLETYYLN